MNVDPNLNNNNNNNSDISNNELKNQNLSSASSSSSLSIYSSPSGTPIGQKETLDRIAINNEPKEAEHQQEANQLSAIKEKENNRQYEELVKLTKIQMANKFDQLEKETELILKQKDNNLIKNFPINNNNNKNDCSIPINSNNNNTNNNLMNIVKIQHSEYLAMEKEIKRLKTELNVKNEIISKLCNIRTQVESELEDLTASLFEEANKMVYDANILRDKAEKELYEATFKIDMLTAEVQALKLMVITSTPSKPNTHLHPHLNSKSNSNDKKNSRPFSIQKKSPSNYELGNKEQIMDTNNKNDKTLSEYDNDEEKEYYDKDSIGEIDPIFFDEFNEWRKCPTLEPMNSNFIKRIYDEEIYPVFNFKNKQLTSLVLRSIENNTLTVETIKSDKLPFPKKCALMESSRICRYRMKIEDQQWHFISQLCRNRITTICDLFCYLRYIQDGLVKSNSKEIFWHIMKRRRNIALSKLGFLPIS